MQHFITWAHRSHSAREMRATRIARSIKADRASQSSKYQSCLEDEWISCFDLPCCRSNTLHCLYSPFLALCNRIDVFFSFLFPPTQTVDAGHKKATRSCSPVNCLIACNPGETFVLDEYGCKKCECAPISYACPALECATCPANTTLVHLHHKDNCTQCNGCKDCPHFDHTKCWPCKNGRTRAIVLNSQGCPSCGLTCKQCNALQCTACQPGFKAQPVPITHQEECPTCPQCVPVTVNPPNTPNTPVSLATTASVPTPTSATASPTPLSPAQGNAPIA